jgi:leucyl aminopeptidase (aminopeptidase T)
MVVTLLSGVVIGGIVSGCAGAHKAKKEREELQEQLRIQKAKDRKLKLQVEFFDSFRELDNKLARMIGVGKKGVAYLINGLTITHASEKATRAFKNIRDYRNQLSHDKRKWIHVPAPTPSIMKDLHYAQAWVERNYSAAAKLVWKGREAFSKKNDVRNKIAKQKNSPSSRQYINSFNRRNYNCSCVSTGASRSYSSNYYNKKAN